MPTVSQACWTCAEMEPSCTVRRCGSGDMVEVSASKRGTLTLSTVVVAEFTEVEESAFHKCMTSTAPHPYLATGIERKM